MVVGTSDISLDKKYGTAPYEPLAYSRRNTGRSSGKVSIVGCASPNMPPIPSWTNTPNWALTCVITSACEEPSTSLQSAAWKNTMATMMLRKMVEPIRAPMLPLSRSTPSTSRVARYLNWVQKPGFFSLVFRMDSYLSRALFDASMLKDAPEHERPRPPSRAAVFTSCAHSCASTSMPSAVCCCIMNMTKSAGL